MLDAPHIERVEPRVLAAVRRTLAPRDIGREFGPALDVVWAFLRARPGLREGGHNVFVYDHRAPGATMQVDFGVEVARRFPDEGEVRCVETPGGEAVVALHRGPYARLHETHDRAGAWLSARGLAFDGRSWEVYGDWTDDERALETTLVLLLKPASLIAPA